MIMLNREPLLMPMNIRKHNPLGYAHGQLNHEGIFHPGYDLNNGNTPSADFGEALYAVDDGVVMFAGKTPGFGTLIVLRLNNKQIDPETGKEIWIGVRYGHPKDIYVKKGDRVKRGKIIGTCGNGGIPSMFPHLHYDIFRFESLELLGKETTNGYPWTYWDKKGVRNNFARYFIDPAAYHPELQKYSRRRYK